MKQLLSLLFLLPLFLTAQPVRDEYFNTIGKPTFLASNTNAKSVDFRNKQVWNFNKTLNVWTIVTDTNIIRMYLGGSGGTNGKDAIVTVGSVSTLTGAPGTNAAATVTDVNPSTSDATLNFTFTIPTGATGATGPAGSGGGGTVTSPTMIFVAPNGVDDTQALQAAVNESFTNGKPIYLAGKYRLSNGIKIDKTHKYLSIIGWAELNAINSNVWTFFYSDMPTSTAEAEGVYTLRRLKFANLVLYGQGRAQTGFALRASEGAEYSFIWGTNLNTLLDVTFGLRTKIDYCEANQCYDGIKIRSGVGQWTNATSSNSCSNGTMVNSYRWYGSADSHIALSIYDAGNVIVNYPVIEGWGCYIGIDFNGTSPTSTGLDVRNLHFECTNPATIAVIKIRSSTQSHFIDAPAFAKPSIYVLTESNGGYPNVTISDVSNARMYLEGTAKYFQSASTNWMFDHCDLQLTQTKINSIFTGTIPNNGCGTGAGANTWCNTNPINR